MTGVVLAGGKSVRFGSNKALELLMGKRLIEHALAALRPFCTGLMVVANDLEPYLDLDLDAALVRDVVPDQGPLGGIYSALLFSPHDWIFARATDMPFLVPALAEKMIESKNGFDAVVPRLGPHFEPLTALYHWNCCPAVARVLEQEGERKAAHFYRKINVRYVSEEEWRAVDPEGRSFRNANTRQELAKLDGLE